MNAAQRRDDSGVMTPGERRHESATLLVSECLAVPEHMRSGVRELTSVFTPEADRRKGFATALLKAVCEEADDAQKVLMLTADDPSLVGFYRRFGFITLPGPAPLMARRPHVAQQMDSAPSIAGHSLPPELEVAQPRIGELRKAGVPLQAAMHQALREAAARAQLH